MNTPKWLEVSFATGWILGTVLLVRLAEYSFDITAVDTWALVSLGLSLFLLINKPLVKRGLPQALEIGTGVFLAGAFVLHFGFVVVGPKLDAEITDNAPCGPKTMEAKCYRLSKSACLSVWEHYQAECDTEARAQRTGVTQLIGAGVHRCTQKRMDKHMSFNQRNEEGSGCASYFSKLKE